MPSQSGVTDAAGHATGEVRSGQDSQVVVSALANGVPISRTATITFIGPDLALSLLGPAGAVVGRTITYTLSLKNNGMVVAQGVVVTDTLPGGISFLSATAPVTDGGGPNADLGAGHACTRWHHQLPACRARRGQRPRRHSDRQPGWRELRVARGTARQQP